MAQRTQFEVADRGARGSKDSVEPSLAQAQTEFPEFYRLADLVEAGLLNALFVLQGALRSLTPHAAANDADEGNHDHGNWADVSEDYQRLCEMLIHGKAFKRLDDDDQARLRLRLLGT